MSVYLSNNGQVTQEPHLNAKTTFPKMTIFGTVIEVPLLAEAMTANLSQVQTSLSCKFRLLHLSSHRRPCRRPWPWMLHCL